MYLLKIFRNHQTFEKDENNELYPAEYFRR